MKLEKHEENGIIHIKLDGKLDIFGAKQFHDFMQDFKDESGFIEIDFIDVPYITSAGLRELLILKKTLPDDMWKLTNVNAIVEEVMKSSGFSKMIAYSRVKFEDNFHQLSFPIWLKKMCGVFPDRVVMEDETRTYTWTDIEKIGSFTFLVGWLNLKLKINL